MIGWIDETLIEEEKYLINEKVIIINVFSCNINDKFYKKYPDPFYSLRKKTKPKKILIMRLGVIL